MEEAIDRSLIAKLTEVSFPFWTLCAGILTVKVDCHSLSELIHPVAIKSLGVNLKRTRDLVFFWILQVFKQDDHFARIGISKLHGISECQSLFLTIGLADELSVART